MNKFYTFHQNNSGGFLQQNEDLDVNVIIEAATAHEANEIAEDLGIYFGGVFAGIDCECCGDRWSRVYETDGCNAPSIYGEHVGNFHPETKIHRKK